MVGDRLLIVEEHLNVISEFRKHPLERLGPRVGCSAYPPDINLPNDRSTAACDRSASVTNLYSPNDAVTADGRVYIADTDNHRVIELLGGRLVAQLTGFNNPVNVRVAEP
jgi:starvation-inducible outer membrane lipoprotein